MSGGGREDSDAQELYRSLLGSLLQFLFTSILPLVYTLCVQFVLHPWIQPT